MPDVETAQPPKAFYYPHVEFGSTAWVKSALLYWEGLVRIRPEGSSPRDDAEIRELIDAGLIEEVSPDAPRRQALPEMGKRLEEFLRAHGGHVPQCIPGIRGIRGTSVERENRVRAEIWEALGEFPLAQKAFAEEPDRARALFLTMWVDKIASERQFAPVTDDPIFDAMTTYFESEKMTENQNKILPDADWQALAELSLPSPSLEAIAELPVSRLLAIRNKYAAQRHHFRNTIQTQLAAIAKLPTKEAIEEQVKTLQAETRDDLEAAREAVKDAKVKDRWTLLGISAPASLAAGVSIAATASPVIGPIGGIGTLALGVTSWFMQRRRGQIVSQSHYLLSLDTAVKEPWRGLSHAFRNLVHS